MTKDLRVPECPYCMAGDGPCVGHGGMKKVAPVTSKQNTKHERRVVGHASGWKEQMSTCVCGKPWPCAEAAECSYCHGNDRNAPCAYPSEGKPGCLRDKRLAVETTAPRTETEWRALHREVATWSAQWSSQRWPSFTSLNKILAAHNPFDSSSVEPTPPLNAAEMGTVARMAAVAAQVQPEKASERRFEAVPLDARPEDPVPPCAHPLAWRRYDGAGKPYCDKCGASENGRADGV